MKRRNIFAFITLTASYLLVPPLLRQLASPSQFIWDGLRAMTPEGRKLAKLAALERSQLELFTSAPVASLLGCKDQTAIDQIWQAVSHSISKDFEEHKFVVVDGWMLSATEAEMLAMHWYINSNEVNDA